MAQHVFLSPHLDDAVLSCGGLIYQLTTKGETVLILTLMAGDPPDVLPNTPLVNELHARWEAGENPVSIRREEDVDAANILNAQVSHFNIPDCIYRTANGNPLYKQGKDLFSTIHPADTALQALKRVVLPKDAMIYAPLGIGNHVDHQIVLEWALTLPAIRFYEDYPYSEKSQVLLDTIGKFPKTIISDTIPVETEAFEAKCLAIAQYRSQISTFWSSNDEMKQNVRHHMLKTGEGILAERYWTS